MKIIFGTVVVLAIFCAEYFHIFGKESGGYDNYAFKGDRVYNDPAFATGSWDYTDSGVTHCK